MSKITFGVEHVGLSVKDVKEAGTFFIDVLGFSKLGEREDYPAIFVTDGITKITLWQVKDPHSATPFNRQENIGLHHLAFKLENDEALDSLYEKMKTVKGVRIEFSPENLGQGPSRHMMVYGPSGIRFEFIARK